MATAEGFAVAAVQAAVEVRGEETMGLEKRDVDDAVAAVTTALIVLLAFPHSASTSAMISPPPEMESKVRREEMSASKELRLDSPGISGGSGVSKGVACSLVLLTSSAVTFGDVASVWDVAVLS